MKNHRIKEHLSASELRQVLFDPDFIQKVADYYSTSAITFRRFVYNWTKQKAKSGEFPDQVPQIKTLVMNDFEKHLKTLTDE